MACKKVLGQKFIQNTDITRWRAVWCIAKVYSWMLWKHSSFARLQWLPSGSSRCLYPSQHVLDPFQYQMLNGSSEFSMWKCGADRLYKANQSVEWADRGFRVELARKENKYSKGGEEVNTLAKTHSWAFIDRCKGSLRCRKSRIYNL